MLTMQFPGVFSVNLCFHNVKNRILFFFIYDKVPGAPEGRSIKDPKDFLADIQRKEKKNC